MKTFEFFCRLLAVWASVEGILVMTAPGTMRAIALRIFPKSASFLEGITAKQFRAYGAVEAVFGLLLGGYFFFLA